MRAKLTVMINLQMKSHCRDCAQNRLNTVKQTLLHKMSTEKAPLKVFVLKGRLSRAENLHLWTPTESKQNPKIENLYILYYISQDIIQYHKLLKPEAIIGIFPHSSYKLWTTIIIVGLHAASQAIISLQVRVAIHLKLLNVWEITLTLNYTYNTKYYLSLTLQQYLVLKLRQIKCSFSQTIQSENCYKMLTPETPSIDVK